MTNLKKDLISISQSVSKLAEKIEKMAEAIGNEPAQAKPAKKTATRKKAVAKAAPKKKAATKRKAVKKVPAEAAAASDSGSLLDNIYQLVSGRDDGISVAEIKAKTGLAPRQVSNALYKLTQKDRIESIKRGVYVTKKG